MIVYFDDPEVLCLLSRWARRAQEGDERWGDDTRRAHFALGDQIFELRKIPADACPLCDADHE